MKNNTEMVTELTPTGSVITGVNGKYLTIGGATCQVLETDNWVGAWYYRCRLK